LHAQQPGWFRDVVAEAELIGDAMAYLTWGMLGLDPSVKLMVVLVPAAVQVAANPMALSNAFGQKHIVGVAAVTAVGIPLQQM
jgi:hypothetical protein